MIGQVLLAGIVFMPAAPNRTPPCSVAITEREPTPQLLVAGAALIIHARAEGLVEAAGTSENILAQTQHQVRFRVLSVLKGKLTADELTFNGKIEPQDDWNDRPVPYDFIRRGGRAGNCFALGHKQGGEYLLLLNPVDRKSAKPTWSPYWAPLLPTNEQIRGADDPWLAWVAQQVKKSNR